MRTSATATIGVSIFGGVLTEDEGVRGELRIAALFRSALGCAPDGDPGRARRGQRPAPPGPRTAARARRRTSSSSAPRSTCRRSSASSRRTSPTSSSPTSACRRPAPTRASGSRPISATSDPSIGVVVLSQYAEPAYALALLGEGSAGRAYLLKERVGDVEELVARHPRGGRRPVGDRPRRSSRPSSAPAAPALAARPPDAPRGRGARPDGDRAHQRRHRRRRSCCPSAPSRSTPTRSSPSSAAEEPDVNRRVRLCSSTSPSTRELTRPTWRTSVASTPVERARDRGARWRDRGRAGRRRPRRSSSTTRPRSGLAARSVIRRAEGFELVGEAASGEEAIDAVAELRPRWCSWTSTCRASTASRPPDGSSPTDPEVVVFLCSTYALADLPRRRDRQRRPRYVNKEELSPAMIAELWQRRTDGFSAITQ